MKIARSTAVLLGCACLFLSVEFANAQSAAQLPKRWGLGVSYYTQKQPYGLESLQIGIPGIDPAVANSLDVDNTTKTLHATFDYWLLPFLDVQLLCGNLDTTTDVKLSKLNLGMPLQDLKVKAKGLVYGGGLTLAWGNESAFATLSGQYMATRMDEEGAEVKAWVITPKLGMMLGQYGVAYVGAMYQKPEETHAGSYPVPPFGTVPYSVKLTNEDSWGYLAGLNFGLTEHLMLTVEGGFGKRTSVLGHLDYRW
jgi:hypothetical protein